MCHKWFRLTLVGYAADFDKAVMLLESKLDVQSPAASTSAKKSKFTLNTLGNISSSSLHKVGSLKSLTESRRISSSNPSLTSRPTMRNRRTFINQNKEDHQALAASLQHHEVEDQLADTLYKRAQAKLIIDPNTAIIFSALDDALRVYLHIIFFTVVLVAFILMYCMPL
jgi:hypothetical protein